MKKLPKKFFPLSLFVLLFFLISSTGVFALPGDINNDGKTSIIDALMIAQYSVGLPVNLDPKAADVNCDGSVTIIDALIIAQYSVGLPVQIEDCTLSGVPHLGRSLNMGNKLEAPVEGSWGPRLEAWNITKSAAAGFDSVRLPVRWTAERAITTAPYTVDQNFLVNRVQWAVDLAINSNIAIIVNMHHYEELYADPYKEKARFLAIWKQVADHFKNYPNDKLVFEILNEPHGNLNADIWNQLLIEAYNIIRQSNPGRYIMIGSAEWGGLAAMNKLQLPTDNKLIFTVHYYEPFEFTHQGAEWVDGAAAWCGTTWTATTSQQAFIRGRLDEVANWAAQHNNIPVYVGEFGVYKNCATPADQSRWVSFIARESEARGFSWGYWEMNAGFGCHGANENDGWNYLYNALIP